MKATSSIEYAVYKTRERCKQHRTTYMYILNIIKIFRCCFELSVSAQTHSTRQTAQQQTSIRILFAYRIVGLLVPVDVKVPAPFIMNIRFQPTIFAFHGNTFEAVLGFFLTDSQTKNFMFRSTEKKLFFPSFCISLVFFF